MFYAAGVTCLSGNFNTATGNSALNFNTDGDGNTAIGDSAGFFAYGNGNIFLGKNAGFNEAGSDTLYIGNNIQKTIIYNDMFTGQLLFGNQQPKGYSFKGNRTLNVLGGIRSDCIRVPLSASWADYVFFDNYKLRPLQELGDYIKINKHLPNIPTEKDVALECIELGAMNAKFLEKIDELMLYILQLQKQIDLQEKSQQSIQTQLDELKKIIVK